MRWRSSPRCLNWSDRRSEDCRFGRGWPYRHCHRLPREGWWQAMAEEPEINLVDLDIYQRSGAPHDQFAWLREHAPVFWHADGGGVGWPGFWAVTRHEDVAQVTRHPEIFSSARRTPAFKELSDLAVERMRLMMINMDPPQHTRQRSFVNRGFTLRMIGQLEEHITQICSGLLDDIAGYGEVDFVTEIAAPLPTQLICELVGAPVEDRDRIFKLSNRVVGFDDPEMVTSPADQMQAVAEMYAYAGELAERRRQQPRDDSAPQLLKPDDAGQELTTLEFNFFFLLLTVAGNETTRNAASDTGTGEPVAPITVAGTMVPGHGRSWRTAPRCRADWYG